MSIKKWLPFIIAALVLCYFAYEHWCNTNKLLFNAIPASSVLMVAINDADKLNYKLQKIAYRSEWQQLQAFSKLEKTYAILDSLFLQKSNKQQKKIIGSLHTTSANTYDYILLTHYKTLGTDLERLVQMLSKQGINVKSRIFKNVTIYEIFLQNNEPPFTIANDGQLILCSNSASLVDEAILQYQKIGNNHFFAKTRSSNNNYDFSMYVNTVNLPQLNSSLFKKNITNTPFEQIAQLTDWVSINIDVEKTALNFELFSALKQKQQQLSNIINLKSASLSNNELLTFLPANTALVNMCSAEEVTQLGNGVWGKVLKQSGCKQWAWGYTESTSMLLQNYAYYMIQTQEKEILQRQLELQTGYKEVENYQNYPLYQANIQHLLSYLCYNKTITSSAFFTWEERTLIIAPSLQQLKLLIDAIANKSTLAQNNDVQQFISNTDTPVQTYVNPKRFKQWLKEQIGAAQTNSFNQFFEAGAALSPIFWETIQKGKNLQLRGQAIYGEFLPNQPISNTTMLWRTQLEVKAISQPQLVRNAMTKATEIMVQDENKKLYLINGNGGIIWTRQLDRPILGKIHELDFYNNGTLYYLFNTKGKVYLLDKNGEDFRNYPIRLSSAANTGLSLVDFDNNGQYTYFIPCGNNNIYGYRYDGPPLKGWSPRKYLAQVKQPLLHLKTKNNNLMVAINENGNLYLLTPEGELHKKVVLGSSVVGTPQIDYRVDDNKLVISCKNGKTFVVNDMGEKWGKKYVSMSYTSDFITADITGSAQEELIYLTQKSIFVFDAKQQLMQFKFPEAKRISDVFTVNLSNNINRIGVFDSEAEQIYLLQNNETVYPNFPISATSPFVVSDLFNTQQNILIASGTDNNIFAYKIE